MQSGNFRMPSSDGPTNLEQGRALCQQGLFLDAVPYFEAALNASERTFGDSAPELAEYMQDLGDVYAAVERPADSLRVFDRLYRLGESILGSNHPQIVTVLWKMSILAERLGMVEDSYEMCNQALSRARLCLRPDEELAKAVVERYSYLANLMREMDEMRRRGEDPLNLKQIENTLEAPRTYPNQALQDPPPAPFRKEEAPYEGAVENLGSQFQNVERMPFSPSLNDALGSASMVNLESINRETKALDAELMAQNARAPYQGHLTGSSVFGQREVPGAYEEDDYSLEDIENLTGRKTPRVQHGGGKTRKFSQDDDKRIVIGRIMKDYMVPIVGFLVLLGIIAYGCLPLLSGGKERGADSQANGSRSDKPEFTFATGDGLKEVRLMPDSRAVVATANGAMTIPLRKIDNSWGDYLQIMASALTEKQIFFARVPGGIEAEDGIMYYGDKESEQIVIAKMKKMAAFAQGIYLRSGSYPTFPPPGATPEFAYNSTFTGKLLPIPIKQVAETGESYTNTQLLLETGATVMDTEMTEPGQICTYTTLYGDAKLNRQVTTAFFVRGLDRDGKFIKQSKPGLSLVIQADNSVLPRSKGGETQGKPRKVGTEAKKSNSRSRKGKSKNKENKSTNTALPVKSVDVLAGPGENQAQDLLKDVKTIQPGKPTRLWLVSSNIVPLTLLHYGLPITLLAATIITFAISRMEGVDIKGKATTGNSGAMLKVSLFFFVVTFASLFMELTVYN